MEINLEITQAENGWMIDNKDSLECIVVQEKAGDREHKKIQMAIGGIVHDEIYEYLINHDTVRAKMKIILTDEFEDVVSER